MANYTCDPKLGCVECLSDAQCDDGNSCTSDSCDLALHVCTHVSNCECKVNSDCQPLITIKVSRPIPPTTLCPTCVDGKCLSTKCYGTCCPEGCSLDGLCTQ
jgi:hypothetical protein